MPCGASANTSRTRGTTPACPAPSPTRSTPVTGKCQPNYHLLSTDGYWNRTSLCVGGSSARSGNADLTVPASCPARFRLHARAALPAPVPRGADARPATPSPTWRCTTGSTTSARLVARQGEGHDRAVAARHALRPVDRRPGHASISDRHRRDHRRAPRTGQQPVGNSAAPDRSTTSGTPPSTAAASTSTPRIAQQLAEEHRQRAGRLHRPDGTGTARRARRRADDGDQEFRLPDELRNRLVGRRQEIRARPQHRRAAGRRRRQSDRTRRCGRPRTNSTRRSLGTGWDTNRRIVTINDRRDAAVPFRFANLSAAQQARSTPAGSPCRRRRCRAGRVLNYLRGDKSNEGVGTTNFRVRAHVLGDIVYSGAVPVGAPEPALRRRRQSGLQGVRHGKASRTPMVYVGANDGMLHAFNDSTECRQTPARKPGRTFPRRSSRRRPERHRAHAVARIPARGAELPPSAGIPLFAHKFYVNATPRVWDIDFANTNTATPPTSGNDWRTILVGGLGAGGRAVYALDVTTPVALTDTEATSPRRDACCGRFTDRRTWATSSTPRRSSRRSATAGSRWSRPGTTTRAARAILYVLNPKNGKLVLDRRFSHRRTAPTPTRAAFRRSAPSRRAAGSLRAAGLRRRPQGQRLAFRPFRSERSELEGRAASPS